jgi:hypothetical protein
VWEKEVISSHMLPTEVDERPVSRSVEVREQNRIGAGVDDCRIP